MILLCSLISSRSTFRKAFLAVNGAAFCWFEWYFTFLPTFRADGLCHLSGPTVVTARSSVAHLLTSLLLDMLRMPVRVSRHTYLEGKMLAFKPMPSLDRSTHGDYPWFGTLRAIESLVVFLISIDFWEASRSPIRLYFSRAQV